MAVGFLIMCALLPLVGRRAGRIRPAVAGAVFAGVAAGASLLAPLRPATGVALVSATLGGAVYGGGLALLLGWRAALDREANVDRRWALATIGSAALGLALGGTLLGNALGARGARRVALTRRVRRAPIPPRPPFPRIAGLSREITPVADHYVVDINLERPVVDPRSWSLEVTGLVESPLRLGLDDLQRRFPVIEEYSVLTCVSNEVGGPLIGNSKWTGVRLADVLDAASVGAEAVELAISCADGYTVSLPVERARHRAALLAIAQNGRQLTVEHGFPCRLRVPQLYGMMNAKWIERIELVDFDYRGYWAERGWSDVGLVRTQSRIDTVAPEPKLGAESWIAGVAWAGDRGISAVEVSLDGGRSWRAAEMREPISPTAWTQWAYRWRPRRRGDHTILCRATDGDGRRQSRDERPPHPAGATGYHAVQARVG